MLHRQQGKEDKSIALRRRKTITVRMTEEESSFITQQARALHISREEYIREALLRQSGKLAGENSDERLLIKIADGLHSVSKSVQRMERRIMAAGNLSQEDRVRLRKQLDHICELFAEVKTETLKAPASREC